VRREPSLPLYNPGVSINVRKMRKEGYYSFDQRIEVLIKQ